MIPEGVITPEHVLSALKRMDTDGVPWHRESVKFELLHEGKGYPPKYAVSLAFKDATGNELDPSNFSGGEETNKFLTDMGFQIGLKRTAGVYLLLTSNEESGWSDKDGHSYHFADTVANYKKIQPGAEFLLSRRLYLGKKIIGVGQIDSVDDEPSNDGKHHFRALFNDYRPLRPPRVLTPELEKEIQSLPNFNAQHSIRVIPVELFHNLAQTARAWIFQANPAYYDVRSAVRTLKEDTGQLDSTETRSDLAIAFIFGNRVRVEASSELPISWTSQVSGKTSRSPNGLSKTLIDFKKKPSE
jgi:hypothetical protein